MLRTPSLQTFVMSLLLTSMQASASENWRDLIQTQPLSEVVIQLSQSFSAEVISPNQTVLSSELNAQITHIFPRPGDKVVQGQTLIKLDCQDQELQLERLHAQQAQIQANLDLAIIQLSRIEQLQARDLSARSQLDEATTQVQQLQAHQQLVKTEKALAKRQIKRCQIHAPFDGIVLAQKAGLGQWMSQGAPLLELLQTQDAEIEVQIPFSWLQNSLVEPDQFKAVFRAHGIADKPLKLIRQSPNIEPRSRSVKLWFSAAQQLPIGLSGQATLTQAKPYIPPHIITRRGEDFGVFGIMDNQLVFLVLNDAQEGRPHAVPADWPQNIELVTQGQQRLKRE